MARISGMLAMASLCTGPFVPSSACPTTMTTAILQAVHPALQCVGDAWKLFQAKQEKNRGKSDESLLPIKIYIEEPKIGLKIIQTDPIKYLEDLPELQGYSIINAKIAYTMNGNEVSITCQKDWVTYFNFRSAGCDCELRGWFRTQDSMSKKNIWQRCCRAMSKTYRVFARNSIAKKQVEEEAMQKDVDFLESAGFEKFKSKGVLFEELGYSKEDWPGLVDDLVEAGIPQVWGKVLKRAVNAKRGAVHSLVETFYEHGVRAMYYMKFQVWPDGEDNVDAFFAIYKLEATGGPSSNTSIKIEQAFDRFIEMEAHQKWKREIAQFPPDEKELDEPDLPAIAVVYA